MSSSSLVEKFEFFVTVERAGLCLGLEDQADQLTLDHDGLHQLLALGQLGHFGVGQRSGDDRLVAGVGGNHDVGLHLAGHLDSHLGRGGHSFALVILRPGLETYLTTVAGHLPQLLTHMGGEGGEHQQQGLHVAPAGAIGVEVVDQGHQGSDSGVELHGLDVLGHLLDGLVDGSLIGLGVRLTGVLLLGGQVPHPVQESLAAPDGVIGPDGGLFKVANEHDIHANAGIFIAMFAALLVTASISAFVGCKMLKKQFEKAGITA